MRHMTRWLLALVVCWVMAGTQASAIPISQITGINANGPVSTIPLSPSTTCSNAVAPGTCPITFHPSWTDSSRLWGVTGNIGGGNYECVTSVDFGLTWATCTTQPWSAGQQHQVASPTDGSVISVADIAGSCTIKRSTDNGTIWTTVFTSAGIQCSMSARAQIIYCQEASGQCDVGNTLGGNNARIHRSTDNGASWSVISMADVLTAPALGGIEFNGSAGVFGSDALGAGLKAVTAAANTWALSTAWPPTSLDRGTPLLFGGATPQIISQNGAANTYHRTDTNGTLIQAISPTDGATALSPGLRALYWSGSDYFMVGPGTTGQAIWVTRDDFVTIIKLYTTVLPAGRVTMYKHNSRILISTNSGGTVGAFFIIQ